MAKANWIDCRCNQKIKDYSVSKWAELTGWTLSAVYSRLDAGLQPVSKYDQRVIAAARGILGYLRKMAPVAHHSNSYAAAWKELISAYRGELNDEVDSLSKGTPVVYLEDDVKKFLKADDKAALHRFFPVLTLQAALVRTKFSEWNVETLAGTCKELIIKCRVAEKEAGEEKFDAYKWWWDNGAIPYDARINIRVSVGLRHTGDSERMRALLLLPSRMPSASDPQRADALEADLAIFRTYYVWRKARKDEWRKAKADGTWTDARSHALSVEERSKFHVLIDKLSTVRAALRGLKKEQIRKLREIIPDSDKD